jgi:hypothetical protein
MAATTSLVVSLIVTSAVMAQPLVPAPMEWHPAADAVPQSLPITFRNAAPVQTDPKPAAMELKAAPAELKAAPAELKAAPAELKAAPAEQKAVPVPAEINAVPAELNAAPAELNAAPTLKAAPAEQPPPLFKLPKESEVSPTVPQANSRVVQQVGYSRIRGVEEKGEFSVRVTPPGLDRLTQRLSEKDFFQTIREESQREPGSAPLYFPQEEPVSNEVYTGRFVPQVNRFVEPFYVCHQPLYFEQKNFERYGWELGIINPAFEVTKYFYDLVMLPYHIGADTCHCYDCSAGKCLPGDPVALMFYPERFSVTGLVFEAATIAGLWFVFP